MVFEHTQSRDYLKHVFAHRTKVHVTYSLRTFAKHLDLSPAALCEVMKGKKILSDETTLKIASRLGLEPDEQDYLRNLTLLERTKDPKIKESALHRLQLYRTRRPIQDLSVDEFRFISDWHHFAILAATEIEGFELDPASVSRRFRIPRVEAELAIERLCRLGMLTLENGKFQMKRGRPRVISKPPNEALRSHHTQTLTKAIESLATQTNEEKFVGSETFAIDPAHLPEYKELIEELFTKVLRLAAQPSVKKDVYHLGVQFFNLSPRGAEQS